MNQKRTWLAAFLLMLGCNTSDDESNPQHTDEPGSGSSDETDTGETDADEADTTEETDSGEAQDAGTDAMGTEDVGGDAAASPTPFDPMFFVEEQEPYGDSFAAWGEAWWQWVASIDNEVNPLEGGDCTARQDGPVWFLAGTTGNGPQMRACEVPADAALFFPVHTTVFYPCPEYETCDKTALPEQLVAEAAAAYDAGAELVVELNGEALPSAAIVEAFSSDPAAFETVAEDPVDDCWLPVESNVCDIAEGARPFSTSGFWVMLEPLPAGVHTLYIYGKDDYLETDVTYELIIAN